MTAPRHLWIAALGIIVLSGCSRPSPKASELGATLAWGSHLSGTAGFVVLHYEGEEPAGTFPDNRSAFCALCVKLPKFDPGKFEEKPDSSPPPKISGFKLGPQVGHAGQEPVRVYLSKESIARFDGKAPVALRIGSTAFEVGPGQVFLVDARESALAVRPLRNPVEPHRLPILTGKMSEALREVVAQDPDGRDWFKR